MAEFHVGPDYTTPLYRPVAARGRVRSRAELTRGLWAHLMVFVAAIATFFIINLATRGAYGAWWFIWPLGVLAAAWVVHLLIVAYALEDAE